MTWITAARRKLYNHCCMFGSARDAVELFKKILGTPMAESSYQDAIARYIYLGDREKALQTAERLATERLWAVAGPTQVRPISFFNDPNLREFCRSQNHFGASETLPSLTTEL